MTGLKNGQIPTVSNSVTAKAEIVAHILTSPSTVHLPSFGYGAWPPDPHAVQYGAFGGYPGYAAAAAGGSPGFARDMGGFDAANGSGFYPSPPQSAGGAGAGSSHQAQQQQSKLHYINYIKLVPLD